MTSAFSILFIPRRRIKTTKKIAISQNQISIENKA